LTLTLFPDDSLGAWRTAVKLKRFVRFKKNRAEDPPVLFDLDV
jgi:hypothetical protein